MRDICFWNQCQDGKTITRELYKQVRDEEYRKLTQNAKERSKWEAAIEILDKLILNDEFVEFLTFISNDYLIEALNQRKEKRQRERERE
jgi:malate synthase